MADLARIKQNVSKMASMKAPEQDIDGYIASEGVTVDDIRNFKIKPYQGVQKQNILGDIFNVPGAAIRSAIQGKGYIQGALQPDKVPSFRELGSKSMMKTENPLVNFWAGNIGGIAGTAADIATNPADLLTMGIGELPVGAGKNLGGIVGEIPIVKALSRFGNKERSLDFTRGLRQSKKILEHQKSLSDVEFKKLSEEAKKVGAEYPSVEAITRKMGLQKSETIQPLQKIIEDEKKSFNQVKDSLTKDITKSQELKADKIKLTKETQFEYKRQVMAELKRNKEIADKALTGESSNIVSYLKDEIPQTIKNYNVSYGKRQENLILEMEKIGQGISKLDNFNILNKTLEEADSIGINTGTARSLLEREHSLALKEIEPQISSLLDSEGKTVTLSGNGQEFITAKNFIMNSRKFKRTLSEAKLSGTQGYADEDIITALYHKNFGDFMSQRIEGFDVLQKEYAPVVQAMKTARRIFNPGNNYNEEQGVNLLKKYALESTGRKKTQLVENIQKSNPFGEGIEQFSPKLKEFGDKVKLAKTKISEAVPMLRKKFSTELDKIEKEYENGIGDLKINLEKAKGESHAKQYVIEDKIFEIEKKYKLKVDEINDIADRIKTHDMIGEEASKKIADFKRKRNEVLNLLAITGLAGLVDYGIKKFTGGR